MEDSDSGFASNLLHEYAYEGIWWMYNRPFLRQWVWTLTNINAILVLGGLGLLLTFSQTRAWVVLREIIYYYKKSVRLDGDTSAEPIRHLSQGMAIEDILRSAKLQLARLEFFTRQSNVQQDSSIISPVFGIVACFNIGIFIIMGVVIPLLISEGALGEALVKTKMTNSCLKLHEFASFRSIDIQRKTDSIFQLCQDSLSEGCASQYRIQQPRLERKLLEKCVFPGELCNNNTNSFEITHSNITATELGVNTKSLVSMNHRLTCSPIHLESFLVPSSSRSPGFPQNRANISVCNGKDDKSSLRPGNIIDNTSPECNMALETWNGPNGFDNSSSGYLTQHGPYEIRVLPSLRDPKTLHSEGKLRKEIRRDDGLPFLVIHRAGKSKHLYSIDDPFFASHKPCFIFSQRDITPLHAYCPDHEATALGCLEQFQFCLPKSGFCTPWGYQHEMLWEARKHLKVGWKPPLVAQIWAIEAAFNISSVYRVLFRRERTEIAQTMTPLTRTSPWHSDGNYGEMYNRNDQWITEVETWFMKGILDSILEIQCAGRWSSNFYFHYYDTDISSFEEYEANAQQYSLCDLILFNDTDYTNIFLVGFWLTVSLLVFICVTSYRLEWFRQAVTPIRKRLIGSSRFATLDFSLYSPGRLWNRANWSSFWIWGLICRSLLAKRLSSDRCQTKLSAHPSNLSNMEHGIASIPLEDSGV